MHRRHNRERGQNRQMSGNRKKNAPVSASSSAVAFFTIVDTILDRCGWPGFLLLYAIYFVERNATRQQKIEIINMYLLGGAAKSLYPYIILGIIGTVAFFAQRFYYHRKIRTQDDEIKRLGRWKSEHQEANIDAPLHHSEDRQE